MQNLFFVNFFDVLHTFLQNLHHFKHKFYFLNIKLVNY
jgi:hypothetical protein